MRNLILAGLLFSGAFAAAPSVSAAEHVIEATDQGGLKWNPTPINVVVGDVIVWKLGHGTHGIKINNWNAIKAHVKVVPVMDQLPFDAMNGINNPKSTSTPGQVLLKIEILTMPTTTALIDYQCTIHLAAMKGIVNLANTVSITPPQPVCTPCPCPQTCDPCCRRGLFSRLRNR